MEYLAVMFFIHSDFSLTPLLTNDFSLNHENFYYIYMLVNSVLIVKNSITLSVDNRVTLVSCLWWHDVPSHYIEE